MKSKTMRSPALRTLECKLDVARFQTVVIEHVLEAVAAIGNGSDARAHALGRALKDLPEGALHTLGAVAGEQLLHALDTRRHAAICAFRSPRRSAGKRMLRSRRSKSSVSSSPRR